MDLTSPMHIGTKIKKIDISLEKNTEIISKNISNFLTKGDVVYLTGELGVGKTTFVRFVINHLQEKFKLELTEIPSPTFNIVNEYLVDDILISHYDLFRLRNKNECKNIGIAEDIDKKITIVEWAEKINQRPKNRLELYYKYSKNFKSRSLIIKSFGRLKKYEFFK